MSIRKRPPDVLIEDKLWEIKSPFCKDSDGIEQNLKRASKKTPFMIIDSYRLKKISDNSLKSFLTQKFKEQRKMKILLMIDKKRRVIDLRTGKEYNSC